MRINTKAVFEWNSDTEQYEEIYSEGYDYEGEVDLLQENDRIYFPSKFSRGEGYAEMTPQEKKAINPRYLGEYLADEDIDWRDVPFDKSRMGMSRDMVRRWELVMGYDRPQGDRFKNPGAAVTEARSYLRTFMEDNPGGVIAGIDQRVGKQVIQDIRDQEDFGYDYPGRRVFSETGNQNYQVNADAEERRKIKGALEIMDLFPELSDISDELAREIDFGDTDYYRRGGGSSRFPEQDIRRTDDRIFDLLPGDEDLFLEGDTKSKIIGE